MTLKNHIEHLKSKLGSLQSSRFWCSGSILSGSFWINYFSEARYLIINVGAIRRTGQIYLGILVKELVELSPGVMFSSGTSDVADRARAWEGQFRSGYAM